MQGGYAKFPQRPSPNSQAVGAALLQQGQGGMAPTAGPTPAGPEPSYAPGQPPLYGGAGAQDTVDSSAAMRAQGARQMGGPGQIDDNATDDGDGHSANAISVAVGEALTRLGGGNNISPNPFKPRERSLQTLRQLGLSEVEARLLVETGGA